MEQFTNKVNVSFEAVSARSIVLGPLTQAVFSAVATQAGASVLVLVFAGGGTIGKALVAIITKKLVQNSL
ncbi:MAG: hypothetical protein OSB34_17400 [Planktomarina sp.]|nr:hypothetical protein [Planktomarina sp.]